MVREEYKELWKCPYCRELYDDEDDASDCARECVDIDSPTPVDKDIFWCEYCNNKFKKYNQAEFCENKHINGNDKFVEIYEKKKSFEILRKAGDHPEQKKITT